jgi:GlpG protein
MRQIGTLPTKDAASRFSDYLLTQGVEVKTEEDAGGWVIWVRDENHLDRAREELNLFAQNPADERYQTATRQAVSIRRDEHQRREQARRNMHDMGDRWNRPVMQRRPLTVVLIALSVFVTALSVRSVGSANARAFRDFDIQWSFAGQFTFVRVRFNAQEQAVHPPNGWQSIQEGQLWRLVTPIFLHFGFCTLFLTVTGWESWEAPSKNVAVRGVWDGWC